jgi:hypothetical protein
MRNYQVKPKKGLAQVMAGIGKPFYFERTCGMRKYYNYLIHNCILTQIKKISLSEVLSQDSLHDLFNLLLSEEAYIQYCELEILIQTISDNNGQG